MNPGLELLFLTALFAFLSDAPLPERDTALDIFNSFFLPHLPSPPQLPFSRDPPSG